MNQNRLPADSASLTLGIVALAMVLVGFCCGPLAVVALVLSIIGLVKANKSLAMYYADPDVYDTQSRSNVSTARILNIIAVVLSGVVTLFYIIYFLLYGALLTTAFMENYRNMPEEEYYEWEDDSLYYEEDEVPVMESDSIYIQEIEIKETDTSEN